MLPMVARRPPVARIRLMECGSKWRVIAGRGLFSGPSFAGYLLPMRWPFPVAFCDKAGLWDNGLLFQGVACSCWRVLFRVAMPPSGGGLEADGRSDW
jgi:hypothetical protein